MKLLSGRIQRQTGDAAVCRRHQSMLAPGCNGTGHSAWTTYLLVLSRSYPTDLGNETSQQDRSSNHNRWMIFTQLDHEAAAERHGRKLLPRTVIAYGNPKLGTANMVTSPVLAIDIPPKVLVWQDEQGKVWQRDRHHEASLGHRQDRSADGCIQRGCGKPCNVPTQHLCD